MGFDVARAAHYAHICILAGLQRLRTATVAFGIYEHVREELYFLLAAVVG